MKSYRVRDEEGKFATKAFNRFTRVGKAWNRPGPFKLAVNSLLEHAVFYARGDDLESLVKAFLDRTANWLVIEVDTELMERRETSFDEWALRSCERKLERLSGRQTGWWNREIEAAELLIQRLQERLGPGG